MGNMLTTKARVFIWFELNDFRLDETYTANCLAALHRAGEIFDGVIWRSSPSWLWRMAREMQERVGPDSELIYGINAAQWIWAGEPHLRPFWREIRRYLTRTQAEYLGTSWSSILLDCETLLERWDQSWLTDGRMIRQYAQRLADFLVGEMGSRNPRWRPFEAFIRSPLILPEYHRLRRPYMELMKACAEQPKVVQTVFQSPYIGVHRPEHQSIEDAKRLRAEQVEILGMGRISDSFYPRIGSDKYFSPREIIEGPAWQEAVGECQTFITWYTGSEFKAVIDDLSAYLGLPSYE